MDISSKGWEKDLETYRPKDKSCEPFFKIWVAEALFGWDEISPFVLPSSRGLEIGAGSGLLSVRMSKVLNEVTALEPISKTFSHSEPVLKKVKAANHKNITICRKSLESFEDEKEFDLIWSVNVFEHIDDWKAGLLKIKSLLRSGGRAIILCPNYDIPYESHFGLPVVGTKEITAKIFSKNIIQYEKTHSCPGLWQSLNFIRVSQIIKFARNNDLQVEVDKNITLRLFERFVSDTEFSKRHKGIGPILNWAYKFGLPKIWILFPARFQPYTALHILTDKTNSPL